jgi:glycosyltransferase involved in cell wall biosynthesis
VRLLGEKCRVVLSVVGNTVNLEPCKDLIIQARKVATVIFHGYLSDKSISKLYQMADVFLFPSLYEGFGIPILEAYSYGIPVVASNVASMPEVGGSLGVYVDPCEPKDIAIGLLKVAKMTPVEREDFFCKAKVYAEKFTWDRTAEDLVKFMKKICNNEDSYQSIVHSSGSG